MLKTVLTAGLLSLGLAGTAFADGDAEKGKKVFNKCKACHAVGEDAKNKVGPVLNGIIGAPAAQNPDFKYSKAMLEKGEEGLVWDEDALSTYLAKPRDFVPGTKMSFAGLKKDDEIEDVLAYLATFN